MSAGIILKVTYKHGNKKTGGTPGGLAVCELMGTCMRQRDRDPKRNTQAKQLERPKKGLIYSKTEIFRHNEVLAITCNLFNQP